MADNFDDILLPLRISVKQQGDLVKQLKLEKQDKLKITSAVQELKRRKATLQDKEIELSNDGSEPFNKEAFQNLCKRRFLFGQSFDLYGGVGGLYDYGPVGCTLKNNIIDIWRQYFIQEEDLLEIEASMLTPEHVLKASGHVDKFTDIMVTDTKTGEFFRADHLLESSLENLIKSDDYLNLSEDERKCVKLNLAKADTFLPHELDILFKKYDIKSPSTGNDLKPAQHFNLMFSSTIGPGSQQPAYLRPETAQGIFVNYPRLTAFNNGKMPFGCAQIGHSFRNEISPRAGLLRVREFQMAEIEYFLDPEDKVHEKFDNIKNLVLNLYTNDHQMKGESMVKMNIQSAVDKNIIDNQSLGYFIGRIYQFAIAIGLDEKRIRFRQHLKDEMAHYAKDCWDLEIQCSSGWIEAAGCADRSCFDLKCHAVASNSSILAKRRLKEPKIIQHANLIPNKKSIGKEFKKQAGNVTKYLASLSYDQAIELNGNLQTGNINIDHTEFGNFTIKPEHVLKFDQGEKKVYEEDYIPSVIEPSFGIGRIFYCLLEHNFKIRETNEKDEDKSIRSYFSLPPIISPYKCSVLRLMGQPEYVPLMKLISKNLKTSGLTHKIDDVRGIKIGKRYARTDEIAIPYGITVDVQSIDESKKMSESGDQIENNGWSVTVRDRDSMQQCRVPVEKLVNLMVELCNGTKKWDDIYGKEFEIYGN